MPVVLPIVNTLTRKYSGTDTNIHHMTPQFAACFTNSHKGMLSTPCHRTNRGNVTSRRMRVMFFLLYLLMPVLA